MSKVGHVPWPLLNPFNIILFFSLMLLAMNVCTKFDVSSFNSSRDEGVLKFQKIGHVTPFCPPWPNFAFLSLVPLVMNLHAKFGVSSSNCSRDMEGVPKFQKYVT